MGYSHGKKWSDDAIRKSINKVVIAYDLKRMPSRSEVEQFYGNTSLTNAISKRCGWYELAKEMGLQIKDSETYFGKKQEEIARQTLITKGFEVRKMPQNYPYDLLVNDCVKVDVKASSLHKVESGAFYSFNIEKSYPTCDIYILYILNVDKSTKKVLVIPSSVIPYNTQISVGEKKSKYDKYADKWEYIEQYSEFYENVNRS